MEAVALGEPLPAFGAGGFNHYIAAIGACVLRRQRQAHHQGQEPTPSSRSLQHVHVHLGHIQRHDLCLAPPQQLAQAGICAAQVTCTHSRAGGRISQPAQPRYNRAAT